MRTKKEFASKCLSVLLCACMLLTCLSAGMMKTAAAEPLNIVSGSKKADPSTIDGWEAYFGPRKLDTEFAGGVWTDKSVFTGATNELPGVSLKDSNNFLVALTSIASNMSITGYTSSPTDTMLVLDLSGSMVDDTYQVGTIRQGYNYQTVNGIDMSLINAMIDATNDTIDKLMKQNTNNRVGVVLYSGNSTTDQAATPGTATLVLPLGRYSGVDGEYLSVDTTYQTERLYVYSNWQWHAAGTATYVSEGTAVNVSVKDGLETEAGGNVPDTSKQANGGTYMQNGLYKAMNEFLNVTDTTVPAGRPQAGAERLPVIVLMTDGAPTIATTSYTDIGNSDTGDGTTTNDRITFLTQLTAAYVRGRVAAKYQENQNDQKDVLFLTLGLGTENSSAATNTLYPAGSNNTLTGYWNTYLRRNAGADVTIISGNDGLRVRREAAVEAMNYVDKYYYASDAQSLINAFTNIVSEIELKAESYATLVEGGNANFSGYVTFEDELGELMHVADVKGVLMGNGNGGTVLYTGKGVAQSINSGILGTVDNPTPRGDELVRTVKERIPGITTTQAQQLIGYAYADQQLYYADDNNWSNYIGWYADSNGEYVGFWDKDSGYENAPSGAVYANKSYGYLGVQEDTDMMHVVVLVRTELSTLHQTVFFKIPASLLPTVEYKVTLDEDDPAKVEKFERENAIPMQLVYEVGLRPDINSVNMEQKIKEHEENGGGQVQRNADGTVTFYTNEWAIGNDKNNNGIPDRDEVETAMVAESHFHPAMDNSRYYYTEDTLVVDKNGNPVRSISANGEYYHDRYIYDRTKRTSVRMPIAEDVLNEARQNGNGQWYIPAGTIYQEVARFKNDKSENITNTLSYSNFPAVFEIGDKQDAYAFLGNNGTFTVAPAQGIVLTKTVAQTSDNPGAPTEFTFKVTLSQAVKNPVITDTDGNVLTGISSVDGRVITVTLKAGQTVVISGIPAGITYTVTEESTQYYAASSDNASGTVAVSTLHHVDFVNTPKSYGSLLVSKDVNYPQGFVPADAHNNTEFTINVTFDGDITGIAAPQGAVQSGNTFTLSLKDGESAAFANIPQGVTYSVEETTPSNGYAFHALRYSDETRTIGGNDQDEAHVVNSYSLNPVSPNVKIQGTKDLVTNETSWGGKTFTVELLRIDNFADDDPVSTGLTDTMSESDPDYEIDLSAIEFTAPGTYYFRAVEVIPDDREENIAYDRTFGLFSITVGDADADGNLEIQEVRAYQTTTVSGSADSGWVLRKDFENVITTDRISLNIQKSIVDAASGAIVNAHLGDITFGLFTSMASNNNAPSYFALTNTQGEASIMIPVTRDKIDAAGGTLIYYMREIAPAVENRVVGVDYDESWIYAIAITWDEQNNKAVAQYAPITNGQIGTYVNDTEGSFTFAHTNTYESNVTVGLDLSGTKTLNGGNDLGGRVFSFSLYKSTAAFVKGDLIETVSNVGNAISFKRITFDAPGVYYMVAKEEASTLGGITVDNAEYHITVAVEKFSDTDGTTRLRLVNGYPIVVRYGTSSNVGATGLAFNNRYTVTGSADVTIGGKKTLNGRNLVAGEFTIGLYKDAACTDVIETTANFANGNFAFKPITYTANDLGALAEKTFTYYVKEVNGGKSGVTYDSTVYPVKVKLSHNNNGQLTASIVENGPESLQIKNTYIAAGTSVTLEGSKVLAGDWSNVTRKTFTFQLFEADSRFSITDQNPVQTTQVTGEETFTMSLNYKDGDEGTHYYVLREEIPDYRGGVNYDAGQYHITVNVTDPGDGKLVAVKTLYRPGTGNTASAVFTNTYTAGSAQYTPMAKKIYEGDEMKTFDFVLSVNDVDVQVKQNDLDGNVLFDTLTFDTRGEYVLKIREQEDDSLSQIRWDDNVYTITLNVVDDGNGQLSVNVTGIGSVKGRDDLVFHNVHHDEITKKDVFHAYEPTVSIDGMDVEKNDVLLYKIAYTNFDSVPVDVTITDTIPKHTTYSEGSADHGGTFDNGVLTWKLKVPAGETVTVSFSVKVDQFDVTINNQAVVYEGKNKLVTNIVTNQTPAPSVLPPQTGDDSHGELWFGLMIASVASVAVICSKQRKRKQEE